MPVVMLPSLKSCFSLFWGGLRGRSRPSLQHLCLHSFPSFLQVWLHAHFPFSSLTGSSDVPSYLRFLDIRLLSLDLVRGRLVFVGFPSSSKRLSMSITSTPLRVSAASRLPSSRLPTPKSP